MKKLLTSIIILLTIHCAFAQGLIISGDGQSPAVKAKHGTAHEQMLYGIKLLKQRKYKQALHWFNIAAQRKNSHAFRLLGTLYRYGIGVTANPEKAYHYYLKAAALGSPDATQTLYFMTLNGFGTKRSLVNAYYWAWRMKMTYLSTGIPAMQAMRAIMSPSQHRLAQEKIKSYLNS